MVERALGKGEVGSSILPGGTIPLSPHSCCPRQVNNPRQTMAEIGLVLAIAPCLDHPVDRTTVSPFMALVAGRRQVTMVASSAAVRLASNHPGGFGGTGPLAHSWG